MCVLPYISGINDISSPQTIRAIIDYFYPISDGKVNYLKSCLEVAKKLEMDAGTQTCPHSFPKLSTVKLYYSLNTGPTVELISKDLQELSPVDYAMLPGYASNVIKDQGYCGKLIFNETFESDGSKKFELTFQKQGISFYAIQIDPKSVRIHSEDGIKILQGIWNKYR
ncbi:MAG: hypothetical protein K0B07_03805 [DPANN group archaeon]|nr:hypothetical protein [DPANN group archaeon]